MYQTYRVDLPSDTLRGHFNPYTSKLYGLWLDKYRQSIYPLIYKTVIAKIKALYSTYCSI